MPFVLIQVENKGVFLRVFETIYFGLFHENVLRRIRFVYVRYHIFYMCVKLYLLIIRVIYIRSLAIWLCLLC